MPIYEDAAESISSLISFSYCASSADITDADASGAYAQTQALMAQLEATAKPLFTALGQIDEKDEFWANPIISHWRFGTPGAQSLTQNKTPLSINLPPRIFILLMQCISALISRCLLRLKTVPAKPCI